MNRNEFYFCDTTVIYYKIHSHSRLGQEVRDRSHKRRLAISNFVRGEYVRGYVESLLHLFFAIKEEDSVRDGITAFISKMQNRPRAIANALQSTTEWLITQAEHETENAEKTLRRLGEYIRRVLFILDHEFPNRAIDPLRCDFGVLSFPQEAYDEDQIFDFYSEVDRIRHGPQCDQCDFKRAKQHQLNTSGIDLYSDQQQQKHSKHSGYVAQAEWAKKAVSSPLTAPSCWYCDRLSDTIIALSSPDNAVLLTGDKKSFPALAEILHKELDVIAFRE